MASYAVGVIDNLDGSWSFVALRAPTTNVSTTANGGTNLNTNTFSWTQATGALASASGFQDAATTTSDGLGHVQRSPLEVLERVKALIADDRAFNG